MTLDDLPFTAEPQPSARTVAGSPKRCRRHLWVVTSSTYPGEIVCMLCGRPKDAIRSRRGKNNRKRGGAAELDVARTLGAHKMGPLGLPWDVEKPGYLRLQVRKYLRPESLRKIAAEIRRIGPSKEMPGYVWIEPGRGGEKLIVFPLDDFQRWHGEVVNDDDAS